MNIRRIGNAKKEDHKVNIRPTVLIGLGGTGKEVLRRLRRMFYEKYRMTRLPVMEYLWFDTDIEADGMDGADLLDQRIDFLDDEKIDGRVMPEDLNGYRNSKGTHSYIWSWFPEALDSLPSTAITQGAGQIRACGRLAFFRHYNRLRSTLETKIERVRTERSIEETRAIFPEYEIDPNRLEIVLVTSIAGGTGSGSFIDMGFLCRDLFNNVSSTAYLVLPSVFDRVVGSRETTRANGFAALKELEHYMQPHFDAQGTGGGRFTNHKFKWDGTEHEVPAPPFSTVYLLENSNLAGKRIADYTDVFQMIAEFLLLDFEHTGFTTAKRSVRSNMEQYLQQKAKYTNKDYVQYFPCRYASFGLSQIEINQPRLANAASNKFAQYLVEFIIAEKNQVASGFDTAHVLPKLKEFGLERDLLINRALYRTDSDLRLAGHAIQEILDSAFADLLQSIAKAPEAQDRTVLERQVSEARSKVESLTRKIQLEVSETLKEEGHVRGDDLRRIQENVSRLHPDLKDRVEGYCIELLCNPLQYGPNYVESFLEYGKEALESVCQKLNGLANELMEDPEVPPINIDLSEDFHLFDQRLKEAEDLTLAWRTKKIALRYYRAKKEEAFKQDAQLITKHLSNQVEASREKLTAWVQKRFRKEAARFLVDLVESIISLLGSRAQIIGDDDKVSIRVTGLHARIQHFRENLQEMTDDFSNIHRAYNRHVTVTGERNLNLTPDLNYAEEIPNYLKGVKSNWRGPALDDFCREALGDYFRSEQAGSLYVNTANAQGTDIDSLIKEGTRELFDRSANRERAYSEWEEVRRTIDDYTFHLFENFKTDIHATEELHRRFPDQEREKIREQSLIAEPRIPGQTLPLPGMADIADNHVGVMDNTWIQRLLNEPIKGAYQTTAHRRDAIIFVNQWMAFPLLSIGTIDDLKTNYEKNRDVDPNNMYRRHMIRNYGEFADILPPENDEEVGTLINAQNSLINGLIMGVIKYNDDTHNISGFYLPYRQDGALLFDIYGHNLERARLIIAKRNKRKERIEDEISKMEDQWREQKCDECFIQRLALKSWLLYKVFPHIDEDKTENSSQDLEHPFRIFLEKSFLEDKNEILKHFEQELNVSEAQEKLDEQLNELTDNIQNFAISLPYRDQFCKNDIHVMK